MRLAWRVRGMVRLIRRGEVWRRCAWNAGVYSEGWKVRARTLRYADDLAYIGR